MNKLTFKQFKEMEDYHSTGSLYKICKECGNSYRPELRTYKKKGWKSKRVVGNFLTSKYCDNCMPVKKSKEAKE